MRRSLIIGTYVIITTLQPLNFKISSYRLPSSSSSSSSSTLLARRWSCFFVCVFPPIHTCKMFRFQKFSFASKQGKGKKINKWSYILNSILTVNLNKSSINIWKTNNTSLRSLEQMRIDLHCITFLCMVGRCRLDDDQASELASDAFVACRRRIVVIIIGRQRVVFVFNS